MIKISQPALKANEYIQTLRALWSGQIASGKYVTELENKFANVCGSKYAVAVGNGTQALHCALLAAGVGPGDEVVTTPFTFIATANAILMCGATPVFVDIEPHTYCLDPHLVVNALTRKTRALLPVNLYGLPADYTSLKDVVKGKDVVIIEDAAQSVGATIAGVPSGSLGDIATFSLYATKNITSGEGGIVTTSNENYCNKVILLRQHGMPAGKPYEYEFLGYNYRLSNINAAIGASQTGNLYALTQRRREIAHTYLEVLSGLPGISLPTTPPGFTHVYHQFTLRILAGAKLSRDGLRTKLRARGIQTGVYYPSPLYHVPHLRQASRFIPCPEAERASREVLSLPIYPQLAEDDVWYIIDSVHQLLR